MAEYIEREDLLELYRMDDPVLNKNGHVPLPVIRQNIMDIPAADVAPVRHGRWVQVICHEEFEDGFVDRVKECCSVCHAPNWRRTTNYCPNCGAKMDGGGDYEM